MADDRLYNLTLISKDYDQVLAVDKSTNPKLRGQTLDTALRTALTSEIGSLGGAVTADYDGFDIVAINATGTSDLTITPTNVPENQVVKLSITRADTINQSIIFSGTSGTVDGSQEGRTTILFDIWKLGSIIMVKQINNQFSGSLESSDLSISAGTISSFNYFTWEINNNMCTVEVSLGIQLTGTTSEYDITIPQNFYITNGYAPMWSYEDNVSFNVEALLTETNIHLKIIPAPTIGGAIAPLYLSATFKID